MTVGHGCKIFITETPSLQPSRSLHMDAPPISLRSVLPSIKNLPSFTSTNHVLVPPSDFRLPTPHGCRPSAVRSLPAESHLRARTRQSSSRHNARIPQESSMESKARSPKQIHRPLLRPLLQSFVTTRYSAHYFQPPGAPMFRKTGVLMRILTSKCESGTNKTRRRNFGKPVSRRHSQNQKPGPLSVRAFLMPSTPLPTAQTESPLPPPAHAPAHC